MDDARKKANIQHAQQLIGMAIVEAMKKAAEDTGAEAVLVDAHLQLDLRAQICAGGAAIMLVYPADQTKPAVDPQGATKLVDDLLRRLRARGGN